MNNKLSYIYTIAAACIILLGMYLTNTSKEKFENTMEIKIGELIPKHSKIRYGIENTELEDYLLEFYVNESLSVSDFYFFTIFKLKSLDNEKIKRDVKEFLALGVLGLIIFEDENALDLSIKKTIKQIAITFEKIKDPAYSANNTLERLEEAAKIAKELSPKSPDTFELKDGEKCEKLATELHEAYDFFSSIKKLSKDERRKLVANAIELKQKSISFGLDQSLEKLKHNSEDLLDLNKSINTYRLREMPISQISYVGCKFVENPNVKKSEIMSLGFDRCMKYISTKSAPIEKC